MFEFAASAFWMMCGILCILVILFIIIAIINWALKDFQTEKGNAARGNKDEPIDIPRFNKNGIRKEK